MSSSFTNLTPRMMIQLAAPHTWSAAIIPVVLGYSYALSKGFSISIVLFLCMLAIAILMQSAVNTLNDYMDYIKGTDTMDNQLDPTDAVLVYNNVSPKSALVYFIVLMGAALVLGIYVVVRSSWITFVIGVIAALIIVLYSAGKTPLSYLPIGEFVSGFTMGGLIMLATSYVLTGCFELIVLLLSVPCILSIGLINMTNNTCDIEKDREADRKTLPAILGRKHSLLLYHATMYIIEISVCLLIAFFFPTGLLICVVMILVFIPGFKALLENPLTIVSRGPAMGQVVTMNIVVNAFYALAIIVGSFSLSIL